MGRTRRRRRKRRANMTEGEKEKTMGKLNRFSCGVLPSE